MLRGCEEIARIANGLLTMITHCWSSFLQSDRTDVQTVSATLNGQAAALWLPPASTQVVVGVVWGRAEHLFSPAFWYLQAVQYASRNRQVDVQLGSDLREEVAACLLGGYGMPAALGLAAFARLKNEGLLRPPPRGTTIRNRVKQPPGD